MALPLRSSQSSWRNRTYIHTQISNNTGGLNKCQMNSIDNIEEKELSHQRLWWHEGRGPGIRRIVSQAQGTTLKAKFKAGAHTVGPNNGD